MPPCVCGHPDRQHPRSLGTIVTRGCLADGCPCSQYQADFITARLTLGRRCRYPGCNRPLPDARPNRVYCLRHPRGRAPLDNA